MYIPVGTVSVLVITLGVVTTVVGNSGSVTAVVVAHVIIWKEYQEMLNQGPLNIIHSSSVLQLSNCVLPVFPTVDTTVFGFVVVVCGPMVVGSPVTKNCILKCKFRHIIFIID